MIPPGITAPESVTRKPRAETTAPPGRPASRCGRRRAVAVASSSSKAATQPPMPPQQTWLPYPRSRHAPARASPRVESGMLRRGATAVGASTLQEAAHLLRSVPAMPSEGSNRRELAGLCPPRHGLGIHPEEGSHLRRGQQNLFFLRLHVASMCLHRFAQLPQSPSWVDGADRLWMRARLRGYG